MSKYMKRQRPKIKELLKIYEEEPMETKKECLHCQTIEEINQLQKLRHLEDSKPTKNLFACRTCYISLSLALNKSLLSSKDFENFDTHLEKQFIKMREQIK